jgi:hypothetical protein
MLDPKDWKAVLRVYAREPNLALGLAYQLTAIKQLLESGREGIPDAISGLNQAIAYLYPHTNFHKLGRRLYHHTIESTITLKEEDLITALEKSLRQSKRKTLDKPNIPTKDKRRMSLVKSNVNAKPPRTRKAS